MNRLAGENSPYLRQHADNPVEWYPWGDEAFERARLEDKPVFVSIGYASCHWCHVMAHESFEDPTVAAALAERFISVKVDREERPDIDAVYMASVQTMTGGGGWPMSVFCLPDGRPFFGGTYFPPADRAGMPSFSRVVAALGDAWATRRTEVEEQAATLTDAVRREVRLTDHLSATAEGGPPSLDVVLNAVVSGLAEGFDATWGGFGPAPKFPRPSLTDLCLWHHRRSSDAQSLDMATTTLGAMAAGGLYDHLVGGFCRYSTDARWLVPHFEKMLTDQALLARAYLHSWQATGNEDHLAVATETLDYVVDELSDPAGGLHSSEDADAGGREGGHATFTVAEAQVAFAEAGRDDLAGPTCEWYGITDAGNWEGTNVLHRPLGAPFRRPPEIEAGRAVLAAARRQRTQPARDDKVLTEWNAMAAATLAEAAFVTGHDPWGERAAEILEFLFAHLRRDDGRWLRSWQGGRARHLALAADHAWVVTACLAVAQQQGRPVWIDRAAEAADQLLALFTDPERGDLFTTGSDAAALVVRPKDVIDGAVPSAASVAAVALLRLGTLRGEARFTDAGAAVLRAAQSLVERHPAAVADMVPALGLAGAAASEVVVGGDRDDLLAVVRSRFDPAMVVAWGEPDGSPLWAGRESGRAYVCHHYACRRPADDAGTLEAQLLDLDRRE